MKEVDVPRPRPARRVVGRQGSATRQARRRSLATCPGHPRRTHRPEKDPKIILNVGINIFSLFQKLYL